MDSTLFRRLAGDPREFRRALKISVAGKVVPLDSVLDDWQRRDFEALDPGWIGVALQKPTGAIRRAYLERPRGHDKTGSQAVMCTYVLFASRKPLVGNACAADKEQAKLLRDKIAQLTRINPWLKEFVDVQRFVIKNPHTGSVLTILASDGDSTFGETPDFIICDELTHWTGSKGRGFWEAVFSGAAKRPWSMLCAISNAGIGAGTCWQWRVREYARLNPDRWYFARLDGPQASWLSEADLAEQAAMLPVAAYKRLWLNQWVKGAGDALQPADVEAAVVCDGPITDAEIASNPWVFAAGLDLGTRHDHSALVIWGTKLGTGRIRLCDCFSWAPGLDGRIDNVAVRAQTLRQCKKYNCGVYYDPSSGGDLMAQDLAKAGIECTPIAFAGKNLDRMARDLVQAFRSRIIDLYREKQFIDDLHRLTIVERKFGFKLEAISDDDGHADRAIAGAIALPAIFELSLCEAPGSDDDTPMAGATESFVLG